MNVFDAAREYIEYGLSIIPLEPKGKKALIPWKEYQTRIATEEEIDEWEEKWPDANIGLVTGSISGVVVIDSDSPEATRWMREKMPKAALYQETGKGFHALFKPNGSPVSNSASLLYDKVDIRGDGGYVVIAPSIHPNGKKYELTSPTGLSWDDLTQFPYELLKETQYVEKPPVTLEPVEEGSRDQTLARIAGKYCAKGMDEQEVLTFLIGLNSKYNPPLPEKDLTKIVTSIFKAECKRMKADVSECKQTKANISGSKPGVSVSTLTDFSGSSINSLIGDFVDENEGEFSTHEIDRELALSSRREKNARSVALNRLAKDGKVKKLRGKVGRWSITKGTMEKMKFDKIVVEPLPIPLPLGLDKIAGLLPGNIVVISGAPNAGKTAFLLTSLYTLLKTLHKEKERSKEKENIKEEAAALESGLTRLLQMANNGIRYLNSEMDQDELGGRLAAYPNGIDHFDDVFFASRDRDFADVIVPDGINFIDFLEIHEDFFELGKKIAEIHNELDGGICFIALQKKQGEQYAKGGFMSTEKPRLVLNIDSNGEFGNICKIVKCKRSLRPGEKWDGKECDFDVKGAKLVRYSSFRHVSPKARAQYNRDYENHGMTEIPDKEYAFMFRLTTGKVGRVTHEQVDTWSGSFPGVDVSAELRRIEADSSRKPFLDKGWFHAIPQMLKKKALF